MCKSGLKTAVSEFGALLVSIFRTRFTHLILSFSLMRQQMMLKNPPFTLGVPTSMSKLRGGGNETRWARDLVGDRAEVVIYPTTGGLHRCAA